MPSKWIVQRKLGTFFPRTTTSPAARAARAASARPVLILNLCILHLHSLSCSPFRLRPRYVLVNIENNKVENKMNSRCRGCHRIGYALYIAISRNLKGFPPRSIGDPQRMTGNHVIWSNLRECETIS